MVEVNKSTIVSIVMDLNEKEARYMRGLLQNYLGDIEDEPVHERAMREGLWHGLNAQLDAG